jgi:hypothetical protein
MFVITFLLFRKKNCILHHVTFCPSNWRSMASHLLSCSFHWRASKHLVSLFCTSWKGNVQTGEYMWCTVCGGHGTIAADASLLGCDNCVIQQVVSAISKDRRVCVTICSTVISYSLCHHLLHCDIVQSVSPSVVLWYHSLCHHLLYCGIVQSVSPSVVLWYRTVCVTICCTVILYSLCHHLLHCGIVQSVLHCDIIQSVSPSVALWYHTVCVTIYYTVISYSLCHHLLRCDIVQSVSPSVALWSF